MDWIAGSQSPTTGDGHGRVVPPKRAVKARSRSPSRDRETPATDPRRRYRDRSRSRGRKKRSVRHDEKSSRRDDTRSQRSGRSRTGGHHHHRRRLEEDSDRGRDKDLKRGREHGMPSHRQDDDRINHSTPQKSNDCWEYRDQTSQSGSRYSSTHHCMDSVMKQQNIGTGVGVISSTPTPPNSHTIRLPPQGTDQHYTSHRCHHPSHLDSPVRSTTPASQNGGHQHHRHRSRRRSSPPRWRHDQSVTPNPVTLPYGARALSRWDFAAFEPLFAHYLEKQRQIRMADLDEESVRDRWKGFVSRWNAGELEKSWYEPEMFLRVVRLRALEEARVRAASTAVPASAGRRRHEEPAGVITPPLTGVSYASGMTDVTGYTGGDTVMGMGDRDDEEEEEEEEEDEDEYAPPLPPGSAAQPQPHTETSNPKLGPTLPTLDDLSLRNTLISDAHLATHSHLRLSRAADRAVQKSRLDDILPPRAEPGTRERQLEKKRLTTESMREFAAARDTGGQVEEIPDAELLGGGAGGGDEGDYKRMLERLRRRKTEREVRREEIVRARMVERDERVREARGREEERLEVLRGMVRERFG